MKKFLSAFLVILLLLGLMILGFMIKRAGDIRQTRFCIDMLERVITEHKKTKKAYPKSLSELPRFYIISASERMYFDSKQLSKSQLHGFRYHFQLIAPDKFVLDASPVGFWPVRIEFAITQDNILRSNKNLVDSDADSYEDVILWQPVERHRGKAIK